MGILYLWVKSYWENNGKKLLGESCIFGKKSYIGSRKLLREEWILRDGIKSEVRNLKSVKKKVLYFVCVEMEGKGYTLLEDYKGKGWGEKFSKRG